MIRAMACLLVAMSFGAAAPDATPPPRRFDIHITCGGGCIDIDSVWRDEDLLRILERGGTPRSVDEEMRSIMEGPASPAEPQDLKLDSYLSDHAEAVTAPPLVIEDLPLQ